MGRNKFTAKPEWGNLLGIYIMVADLGKQYVYERQLVDTFLRDATEYCDITPERAQEIIDNKKGNRYWVETDK